MATINVQNNFNSRKDLFISLYGFWFTVAQLLILTATWLSNGKYGSVNMYIISMIVLATIFAFSFAMSKIANNDTQFSIYVGFLAIGVFALIISAIAIVIDLRFIALYAVIALVAYNRAVKLSA